MPHPGETSTLAYKKAARNARKSLRTPANEDLPAIRLQEKHYKSRFPPPSLEGVLDLATRCEERKEEVDAGVWKGSPDACVAGEIHCEHRVDGHVRRAFRFPELPGTLRSESLLDRVLTDSR